MVSYSRWDLRFLRGGTRTLPSFSGSVLRSQTFCVPQDRIPTDALYHARWASQGETVPSSGL